jgi:hypothetical protein
LFTPIAPKPLSARKYLKLALELRKVEAGLLEHIRSDVCAVLERRVNANRPDIVAEAVADGLSIRDASARFGVSEVEIHQLLEEATEHVFGGQHLRREWMLEAKRLAIVGRKFYRRAVDNLDAIAASVYLKSVERRAVLSGANAPAQYSVHLINQAAPKELNSTEHYKQLFDSLQNYAPREQELEDKDWNREPMTDAETEELDRFREEREVRRRAEHDTRREQRRLAHAKGAAPGPEG